MDIANLFGYTSKSARVLCGRYVRRGLFTRIRKDLYVASFRCDNLTTEELFVISSYLRIPSYISLMSALSYYGITTQLYRNYFESVTLRVGRLYGANGTIFNTTR